MAVSNGATVVTGQRLADYADTQAQALCQGGSSTGPHTHVTLLAGGAQVAIDQSEFSGWRINATNVTRDYDSNCAVMNLTRDGITACATTAPAPPAGRCTLPAGHPSSKICDLDIDGSGTVEPDRDGVLLLRYMFGMRGNALIAGVDQIGAARTLPATIESYIASKDYDLDRSGNTLTAARRRHRPARHARRHQQRGRQRCWAAGHVAQWCRRGWRRTWRVPRRRAVIGCLVTFEVRLRSSTGTLPRIRCRE